MFRITNALIVAVLIVSPANAQTWNAEQREILEVLEATWDSIRTNGNWIEELVHENAVYWDWDTHAPRNRTQLAEWENFNNADGSRIRVVTVNPVAIVVEGDTAVAHYYATLGTVDIAGNQSNSDRRCSDILIRDGREWKFFTWVCGPLPAAGE
jgi:hypothetical protein